MIDGRPNQGDWHLLVHGRLVGHGFANTDLDAQLKQHRIQKIILVGFIANSCVEATARYGMELGYHVSLIKDATAAFNPEGMVAFEVNTELYAHRMLTTTELLAGISK